MGTGFTPAKTSFARMNTAKAGQTARPATTRKKLAKGYSASKKKLGMM